MNYRFLIYWVIICLIDSPRFVGHQAGYNTTSGIGNTFSGVYADRSIATGSHNTMVGNNAGPASLNSDDNEADHQEYTDSVNGPIFNG